MPPTLLTAEHVALAERAVAHARGVLTEAADVDAALPTPCPGWDVRRLLLHVADSADLLTGVVITGERRLPDPPRSPDGDPAVVADARVTHLLETLVSAARGDADSEDGDDRGSADSEDGDDRGSARVREAAFAAAIELTAHAWDIAVAISPGAQVPDGLAADVLDLATSLIGDDVRAAHFGPRVDVPPTATASDRLMGFLGRDPAWPVVRKRPQRWRNGSGT